MGNWNITIRGCGIHHNKLNLKDANKMAARFVMDLRDAGHTVTAATITHGGEDDVSNPAKYLVDRDVIEKA